MIKMQTVNIVFSQNYKMLLMHLYHSTDDISCFWRFLLDSKGQMRTIVKRRLYTTAVQQYVVLCTHTSEASATALTVWQLVDTGVVSAALASLSAELPSDTGFESECANMPTAIQQHVQLRCNNTSSTSNADANKWKYKNLNEINEKHNKHRYRYASCGLTFSIFGDFDLLPKNWHSSTPALGNVNNYFGFYRASAQLAINAWE